MMKSITVTSQNAINYGAVLQAYALQQLLFKLNVQDQIVDLEHPTKIFSGKITLDKNLIQVIFINLIRFLHIFRTVRRIQKFKAFLQKNIKMTKHYKTISELQIDPPVADIFITGSDQMFNTQSIREFNFLKFGAPEIKRISYATSRGDLLINEEEKKFFVDSIEKYSHLSVREEQLKDLIEQCSQKKCCVNIDPTFLLDPDQWLNITGKRLIKEKYAVCYALLDNPLMEPAIKKLSLETGLKIIVISVSDWNKVNGDRVIRSAGIEEFLSLFYYSDMILTTSFHGVCFSIIFEKPFFALIRKVGETRITNLLQKFNLENHILTEVSQININSIDYHNVRKIIIKEKQDSINYLISALGIKDE